MVSGVLIDRPENCFKGEVGRGDCPGTLGMDGAHRSERVTAISLGGGRGRMKVAGNSGGAETPNNNAWLERTSKVKRVPQGAQWVHR